MKRRHFHKEQAMQKHELNKHLEHICATYHTLRFGMALIAAAFPLWLSLAGLFVGVPFQESMSAYYWATPEQTSCSSPGQWAASTELPPMQMWFVGLLFVLGTFLYLYKGFSCEENWALNLAGFCAFGVALAPMPWGCDTPYQLVTAHGVFAVSLFLCIAYVTLRCADDTLHLIANEKLRRRYHQRYRALGYLMIVWPLIALALSRVTNNSHAVFSAEAAAIWAFAFYWWTKSIELQNTSEELLASHSVRPLSVPVAIEYE
jgi:hypothetical protein